MRIPFVVKDAGRNSLIEAIGGMLVQDIVYDDISAATHATGGYIIRCTTRQRTWKGATFVNIRFNVTGAGRRAFAQAVGEILGCEVVYNRTPSFTYTVGEYVVDREGALICPANADTVEADNLMKALRGRGYEAQVPPPEQPVANAAAQSISAYDRLTIEMPEISPTAMPSLRKIIAGKEMLLKKAFGTDSLPVETDGSKIRFPWFTLTGEDGEMDAYLRFVTALCEMAKRQKRVTAKEREVDNDKFAMRLFLVRLGFVGPALKQARKILLRNLSGNTAWKNGHPLAQTNNEVGSTASNSEAAPYDEA